MNAPAVVEMGAHRTKYAITPAGMIHRLVDVACRYGRRFGVVVIVGDLASGRVSVGAVSIEQRQISPLLRAVADKRDRGLL